MSRRSQSQRNQGDKKTVIFPYFFFLLIVLIYSFTVFFTVISNNAENDTRNIATDLRDYLEENGKHISNKDSFEIVGYYQENHIIKLSNTVERKIIRQYLQENHIEQINTEEERFQEVCKNLSQLNMSIAFGVIATLIALATLKTMDKNELISLTKSTLCFIAYSIMIFAASYSEYGVVWVYKVFIVGSIIAQIATLWITFWIINQATKRN